MPELEKIMQKVDCCYYAMLTTSDARRDKKSIYLNHYANNTLNAHDENAFRTLFGRVSVAVADCVLCLDAEQKRRSESVNVADTRFPAGCSLII